jgi:hypothetical protein
MTIKLLASLLRNHQLQRIDCVHSHARVKSAGMGLQQFQPGERDNGESMDEEKSIYEHVAKRRERSGRMCARASGRAGKGGVD